MVTVAQLVRVSVCGSEGRGFETHQSPKVFNPSFIRDGFFIFKSKCFNSDEFK